MGHVRPEQQGKEFAKYNEYSQWLRDQGLYVGGDALAGTDQATTVQARDGKTTTTDGPFAETKEQLGGYYVIEAENLDRAIEAAARCPEPRTAPSRSARSWTCRDGRSTGPPPATRPSTACSGASPGVRSRRSIRILGDFDLAEEAVQDAFAIALQRWPRRRRAGQPGRVDHDDGAATARSTGSAASAGCATAPRRSNGSPN